MVDRRLAELWRAIESGEAVEHTSIVVPSLSFDSEELSKIAGAPFYEERLLFSLIRLRDPRARVIYVTSQPLHPDIVDYYLGLLAGVSVRHARSRLWTLCCHDATNRPLTEKILERPRLVARIRQAMGDPARAYVTCFNSTPLERTLAERLGVPLNGCDPDLFDLGGKSGSREIFRAAGVPLPNGRERLHTRDEVLDALTEIWRPGLRAAVIKLDHSFAGAGNALVELPRRISDEPEARRAALAVALLEPRVQGGAENFFAKLRDMGGIVEEMADGRDLRSPSVQMRITPTGELEIVSTHDQILGGATGQSYTGCLFPADPAYRSLIQDHALAIGRELRERGVISRFAVDFVVARDEDDNWRAWAIEINLRMGGTTIPFLALQFLTGGRLEPESGEFVAPDGRSKFYRATDSLASPAYRGLLPDDLMDILDHHGIGFSADRQTGVLFHMMGALSQFGKVGVTTIGDTPAEAEALFEQTVAVLDRETRGDADSADALEPISPPRTLPME